MVDTDKLLSVLVIAGLSCCCVDKLSLDLSVEGMLDTDESLSMSIYFPNSKSFPAVSRCPEYIL